MTPSPEASAPPEVTTPQIVASAGGIAPGARSAACSEPSFTSSVRTAPLRIFDAVTAFVSSFAPVTAW